MDLFHDEEECDDYVEAEVLDFANIPTLRLWLRSQDGLKIHGVSLTNRETLESAFILLDKGRTLPFKQFSAEYLARRVGILEPTGEPKKMPRTYQERFEDLKTAKRALSGL
jgi:hypothetical protein